MSKTFCPVPWVHVSTRNSGDLRMCCMSYDSATNGSLKDDDGRTYNCRTDRVTDSRNAPLLKQIRKQMLAGEKPDECKVCWTTEDLGINSMRQNEAADIGKFFDYSEAKKITDDEGKIPLDTPIMTWDLRLGNTCNLKCIMCGPYDSNSWYTDYKEVFSDTYQDHGHKVSLAEVRPSNSISAHQLYNWHESSQFWSELEKYADRAKTFSLAGGEPLLVERHYELLETCVRRGYAKNIALSYASNITHLPERVIEVWRHFREVRVACSVDAVGIVGEYIRYGSQWLKVETNIIKLMQLGANIKVYLNPTVGALNIYYLPELVEWTMQFDSQKLALGGHLLTKPAWLSPQIHSLTTKTAIQNKYQIFFKKYEKLFESSGYWKYVHGCLAGYLDHMQDHDGSYYLAEFFRLTEKIDSRRTLKLHSALPELWTLMKAAPENPRTNP